MLLFLVFLVLSCCILFSLQYSLCQLPSSWKDLTRTPPDSRRSSIGTTETKLTQEISPYRCPPLRLKSSTRMAMGLKRLEMLNWLTLDSFYLPEHALRLSLLKNAFPKVVQCLPGSEAACHEVLSVVTIFLATRFPQHFAITSTSDGQRIENHLTGESYVIGCKCEKPLEVVAKLAMEDFNILIKNSVTGEYHLQASATLFPAGWKLQERIGMSMANLHKPVPAWKEKLGGTVDRYFDHLSSRTAMERTNLFIQTTPDLFQDAPEAPPSSSPVPKPSHLMVRRERQTFTRLEKVDAVLFTVRTYMQPMTELGDEEIKALRSHILGWEEEVRVYKGYGTWGGPLLKWCEDRVGIP